MTSRRVFFMMIGVVVLAAGLFVGGAVLGNLRLSKQAKVLVNLKLEEQVVEAQQSALIQAKKDLEEFGELKAVSLKIVPQDKDQARTVREINKIAEDSGIKLALVDFQTSNLGQAPPPTSTDEEGQSSQSTPSAPLTQVKPVEGIPGVFSLEITIAPNDFISYNNLINFLERLENNRRTAHVSKIIITPDAKGGGLSFTITLNAYIKP